MAGKGKITKAYQKSEKRFELNSDLCENARKMKDCEVRLDRMEFSKIRIGCTAECDDDNTLKCNIKQTGADRFTIRIGR